MTTTTPKPTDPKPCDPELLALMRGIYSRYTGYEVADAIRIIRQELEQQRAADLLDEEISRLLLKREQIRKAPVRLQKSQTLTAEQDPQ